MNKNNNNNNKDKINSKTCLIIGAGLAGAACANQLIHRGWRVVLIDSKSQPSEGASGLLAGLFCPNDSNDNNRMSRLTRAGLRLTLQALDDYLPHSKGKDWQQTGVFEHQIRSKESLLDQEIKPFSSNDCEALNDLAWSQNASNEQKEKIGLASDSNVIWHPHAGWLKPAKLIHALLQPHLKSGAIQWIGNCAISQLKQNQNQEWQALDISGDIRATAQVAIIAAGFGSPAFIQNSASLQLLRGQLTWDFHESNVFSKMPFVPINGLGSLIAHIPTENGLAWHAGSTFDLIFPNRDFKNNVEHLNNLNILNHLDKENPLFNQINSIIEQAHNHRETDQIHNLENLKKLLPNLDNNFFNNQNQIDLKHLKAWTSVRCISADRLPLVGLVDEKNQPNLWLCTALGTRGLTWGLLCAELLVSHLTGEPLPIEISQARALLNQRFE